MMSEVIVIVCVFVFTGPTYSTDNMTITCYETLYENRCLKNKYMNVFVSYQCLSRVKDGNLILMLKISFNSRLYVEGTQI